jgi:hypothetical protein
MLTDPAAHGNPMPGEEMGGLRESGSWNFRVGDQAGRWKPFSENE